MDGADRSSQVVFFLFFLFSSGFHHVEDIATMKRERESKREGEGESSYR
jgi:hypothetical protein